MLIKRLILFKSTLLTSSDDVASSMNHPLFWFKPIFNLNKNVKQVMAKGCKILGVEARNLIVQLYKQKTSQTEIAKLV